MPELHQPVEFWCRETDCVFEGRVSTLDDLEQVIRAAKVHDHNLSIDWNDHE